MLLHSLSDKKLLSTTHELTRRERRLALSVLLHLNEIERRKLHLELAYKSMFEFCTAALGYSESAASRRLRVARCVARFPEVYALLESNEVNVSTVAQVARVLSVDNKVEILARIRGRSQRQVEAIVAEYEPRAAAPRDRVRTVVVRVPVVAAPSTPVQAANVGEDGRGLSLATDPGAAPNGRNTPPRAPARDHNRNGCECKDGVDSRGATGAVAVGGMSEAARLERLASIHFCASEAFMAKIEKVKSLVWHRLPANATFEQVFELALDFLIAREDPSRRQSRREQRAGRQERGAVKAAGNAKKRRENPRHIPMAVRDTVFRERRRPLHVQGWQWPALRIQARAADRSCQTRCPWWPRHAG